MHAGKMLITEFAYKLAIKLQQQQDNNNNNNNMTHLIVMPVSRSCQSCQGLANSRVSWYYSGTCG